MSDETVMSEAEYEAKDEEHHQLAYRVGVIYARLRELRRLSAPGVIIDHEQQRLDAIADRVTVLERELIDHEMLTDEDDDDDDDGDWGDDDESPEGDQ